MIQVSPWDALTGAIPQDATQQLLEAEELPKEQRELVEELHRRILALCQQPAFPDLSLRETLRPFSDMPFHLEKSAALVIHTKDTYNDNDCGNIIAILYILFKITQVEIRNVFFL